MLVHYHSFPLAAALRLLVAVLFGYVRRLNVDARLGLLNRIASTAATELAATATEVAHGTLICWEATFEGEAEAFAAVGGSGSPLRIEGLFNLQRASALSVHAVQRGSPLIRGVYVQDIVRTARRDEKPPFRLPFIYFCWIPYTKGIG